MHSATLYAPPRTGRLAGRFFWKECRRLWGMALGLAVIAMLLMLFVASTASPRVDVPGVLVVVAIGAGAMLAIFGAVAVFSVEKEEGTADLLARLPQHAGATAIGKVASAAVVVFVATLAMLLAAWLIAGREPRNFDAATFAQQSVLVLAEAFVWGLVASLVCGNPLVAAVLGIAAASASSQAAIALTNPSAHAYTVEAYVEAAPARAMLVAAAALAAGWLASRWPAPLWRGRVRGAGATVAAKPQAAEVGGRRFGGSLGVFGRLVWQTLRESWLAALGAVLLGLFLTFVGVFVCQGFVDRGDGQGLILALLGSLFAPALLGAVVFRADQRRGAYRFLAEHAGRPRMVCLARNAVWLALLVMIAAAGSRLVADLQAQSFQANWWFNNTSLAVSIRSQEYYEQLNGVRWLAILSIVAAYAFGQYYSLSVRSTVIAAMLSLGAAVLVAAWGLVVWAWRLPPTLFVLPLAVMPLVASWLRARDWMFDRRGVWRWIAPIAALVAPLAWIAWATPGTRLAQVREVIAPVVRVGDKEAFVATPFGTDVEKANQESAEGRTVRDAYERLAAEVEESKKDRLSDKQFAELDRLSRIRCRLPIALGPRGELTAGGPQEMLSLMATQDTRDEGRLERLVVARRLNVQEYNGRPLEQGYHSEYLAEDLMDWATTKGRTSKEVLAAIEGLREIEGLRFDPTDPKMLQLSEWLMLRPSERLMNHYLQVRSVLTGDEPLSLVRQGMGTTEWLALTAHESLPFERVRSFKALDWLALTAHESLPFERVRSFKALDAMATLRMAYLVRRELATIDAYRDPALAPKLRVSMWPDDDFRVASSLLEWGHANTLEGLRQLKHVRTSHLASLAWGEPPLDGPLYDWQLGVAWRRAERVRLALIAYRIDHDEYPEKLAALAPDYLDANELHDLYSGQPLGWKPEGFELPIANTAGGDAIAVGTPVLWSGGPGRGVPTQQEAVWDELNNQFSMPFGEFGGGAGFGGGAEDSERVPAIFIHGGFALPVPK